jgi:predicted glutamine amidotransferase
MARLVGFLSNRSDMGAPALALEASHLAVRRASQARWGWGVGYHHAGELLLQRRPLEDRPWVSVGELVRGLRADMLIAHVRQATVGPLRTENTHPFRYRQWLFAHTGTLAGFDAIRGRMQESIPPFLQRALGGDTDSELLFLLVLSFLHDGGQLDRAPPPAAVRSALRSSLSLVAGLAAEEGLVPAATQALIGCPDYLVMVTQGAPAALQVVRGEGFERALGDGGLGRMRVPDFATSQVSLLAAGLDGAAPAGWREVPAGSIVTAERSGEPAVEPL